MTICEAESGGLKVRWGRGRKEEGEAEGKRRSGWLEGN
jgi:hypothetical protein